MAQPAALDRDHSTSALFEVSHPFLQTIEVGGLTLLDDPGASNGVTRLAVRQKVSHSLALFVDVPFGHYDWTQTTERIVGIDSAGYRYDTLTAKASGTSVGNVCIGVETLTPGKALIWDYELRFNLHSDQNVGYVGLLTDITQWAAFSGSFISRLGLRTHTDSAKKLVTSFRGGLSIFKLETGDIWLDSGLTAKRRLGSWFLAPAIDAVYAFSDFRPFPEHLVGQLELAGGHDGEHARPELFARYYLSPTWRKAASWSLGLRMGGF